MGVHDANLLFLERDNIELGLFEIYGLIESGLSHFESKLTPLWYWLATTDEPSSNLLSYLSIIGTSADRIGALQAMMYVGDPITTSKERERDAYLTSWLSKESSNELKVAALAYLGEFGRTEDLVAIRAEFDTGNHQTMYATVDAIPQINLRNNRAEAVRALIELQPESIRDPLLEALFENGLSIETGLLAACVSHRNAKVRRVVISLLRQRGAIDIDTANRLILDPDQDVRLEALKSLVDLGRAVSDEEAKGILIKPVTGFGLLGGMDHPGERNWRRWHRERLAQMQLVDLERVASNELILDRTAYFVWAATRLSEEGPKLRQCIDNRYQAEFEVEIGALEEKMGLNQDAIERVRSLEESIRKSRTREGLDIICGQGDIADLPLVRRALVGQFVRLSKCDLTFLQRCGNWEDIHLIVGALRNNPISLLMYDDDEQIQEIEVAKVLYKLGWARLQDLCDIDIPKRILGLILIISIE